MKTRISKYFIYVLSMMLPLSVASCNDDIAQVKTELKKSKLISDVSNHHYLKGKNKWDKLEITSCSWVTLSDDPKNIGIWVNLLGLTDGKYQIVFNDLKGGEELGRYTLSDKYVQLVNSSYDKYCHGLNTLVPKGLASKLSGEGITISLYSLKQKKIISDFTYASFQTEGGGVYLVNKTFYEKGLIKHPREIEGDGLVR